MNPEAVELAEKLLSVLNGLPPKVFLGSLDVKNDKAATRERVRAIIQRKFQQKYPMAKICGRTN